MIPSWGMRIKSFFIGFWEEDRYPDSELINVSLATKVHEGEPYSSEHDYWQNKWFNESRLRALVKRGYPVGVWFYRYNRGACLSWGKYTEWRIIRKGLFGLDLELNHHNEFDKINKP